jgi:phospholipid transport system substrate-binding protein
VATLLATLWCGQALAASEARQQLEATINEVLTELKKPELKNPATKGAVLNKVEGIIRRLFSFEELSMRTVGQEWRKMTPDQKQRFMNAFETLLRESYLDKLEGYNGEQVSYVGESSSTKGDKVEIKTTVNIKDKPVPVDYRMLKKGRWVVYDVIIENVSMVQNYRQQFQDIVSREGPERLIELVQAKAQGAKTQK